MLNVIEARKALYGHKPVERRLCGFEVRQWEDSVDAAAPDAPPAVHVGLTGYASTFNEPYAVRDWLGEYHETIMPGAFTKALQERQDVRLLINHEGLPIARTKSGTMTLTEDAHGLNVDVRSLDSDSPLVQSVRSAMMRGDVDQMSFAFSATRQEWNDDYTERFVREVKLFDVSLVTYPANEGATAKLRGGLPFATLDRLATGTTLTDDDVSALEAYGVPVKRAEQEAPPVDAAPAPLTRRLAQLRAIAASL